MKKGQSKRLTSQHKESKGVEGIFGDIAKLHDNSVSTISKETLKQLETELASKKKR